MPNWCNNTIEIQAEKEMIDAFESYLSENDGKDWFTFFKPLPENLKDDGWYEWSIENWGCKWNCDAQDWTVQEYDEENLSIRFWFDSPWGPPIALYEHIYNETDFEVFGNYHEEGMGFVGRFEYGDNEQYEYSDLESLDDIPEDIVDEWNLREMLEDREEWDEDEEDE